jgi:hypothetical protein
MVDNGNLGKDEMPTTIIIIAQTLADPKTG